MTLPQRDRHRFASSLRNSGSTDEADLRNGNHADRSVRA